MFAVLVFIGMLANVLGTICGGSDNWSKQVMSKYKIVGIDDLTHTAKVAYVEANSKAQALNIAYHQPFYTPIRVEEIQKQKKVMQMFAYYNNNVYICSAFV